MQFYLVLENCEGGDLFKTMMKAGGKLAEQAVRIIATLVVLWVLFCSFATIVRWSGFDGSGICAAGAILQPAMTRHVVPR